MSVEARWPGDEWPEKHAAWKDAAREEAGAWESIARTANAMAVGVRLGIPTRDKPTTAKELVDRLKTLHSLSERTHELGVAMARARDAYPTRQP